MDRFLKKRPLPSNADGDRCDESTPNSKNTCAPPPLKKQKQLVRFREAYKTEWPFIKASHRGESYAHCIPCGVEISIGSGGKDDIRKHIQSNKHSITVKQSARNNDISAFINKGKDLSVIRSEVLWSKFVIDRNLPIATSDHFRSLLKEMCPDSEIAKKFSCGRTKTSAIATCLAKSAKEELVSKMKSNSFCIGTDGSNDHNKKLYPIVVTINDAATESVTTNLLSVPELKETSTAENISKLIVDELKHCGIPVQNCLGFISDNANVMVGKKGGVSALLKREQPNLVSLGCGCHLINLSAKKAVSSLPVKVDELLVDVYFFFHHSDKRVTEFNNVQLLYNEETKKILKHCPTRWLCLSASLQRLVDLWEPLLAYVTETRDKAVSKSKKAKDRTSQSTDPAASIVSSWFSSDKAHDTTTGSADVPDKGTASRQDRIIECLSSKRTFVYCCFLLWVMPVFDKYNRLLQKEEPLIYNLRTIYHQLYRELLTKFIRPEIITKHTNDITKLDIEDEKNHIKNKDLFIGSKAQGQLEKLRSKFHSVVYSNIKQFYIRSLKYMQNNFPLQDETLQHASFTNIERRHQASFSDISFFMSKIPMQCSEDTLHEEFIHFQSADLPESILQEKRVDKQWNQLLQYVNPVDNSKPFGNLSKMALSVLTIPHSNAASERIFSLVRKNRNETRSLMGNDTLNAILVSKVSTSTTTRKFSPSDSLLEKCKRATMDSLHYNKA